MLTLKEIQEGMKSLRGWSLEGEVIVKDFSFKDFKESLAFVNKVGEIAEKEGHHPDIVLSYNRVRLMLTTHSSKGLTAKDFEVAALLDQLLS